MECNWSFVLTLLMTTVFAGEEETPTETSPPQQEGCYVRFGSANLRFSECVTEGLGFGSELYYNLLPDDVEILYRVPEVEGWISFGFSTARAMNPADCVIGWSSPSNPTNNRVGDWYMDGKTFSSISEDNNQEIETLLVEQTQEWLAIYFRRPRIVEGVPPDIGYNGTTPIIYGWGSMPGCEVCPIPYHGRETRAVLDFNFLEGGVIGSEIDLLTLIHAFLGAGAWGVIAPIGITIARFGRKSCKGTWFYLHRSCMMITVMAGIAAAVIGIVELRTGVALLHFILGVTVTALGFMQPVLHLFKPKKGKSQKTKKRVAWEISHKLIGYSLAVLAPVNIWFGMELIEFDEFWFLLFWCCFSAIAMVYVMLTIREVWSQNFERTFQQKFGSFRDKLSTWTYNRSARTMNTSDDIHDDFLVSGDSIVPTKDALENISEHTSDHTDLNGDFHTPPPSQPPGPPGAGTPSSNGQDYFGYRVIYSNSARHVGSQRSLRNPVGESITSEEDFDAQRRRWRSV